MGARKRKMRHTKPTGPRRAPRGIEMFPYTLPDGRRVLYVGDAVRECDPPAVREGIVRRRLLATRGQCPCGARSPFGPVPSGVSVQTIPHGHDCPAAEENLTAAMRKADRA
jgi:hypothetical protein